jgi:hypothetical protein
MLFSHAYAWKAVRCSILQWYSVIIIVRVVIDYCSDGGLTVESIEADCIMPCCVDYTEASQP